MFQIILIAVMIHRPAAYVGQIYNSAPVAPLLAVSLVESEAWFNPKALNRNWDDAHEVVLSTDWGFWQLNDGYHPQYRDNLTAHVRYGGNLFTRVLFEQRFDFRAAISAYNTGNPRSPRGLRWADKVLSLYRQLQICQWWPA